MTDSVADAHSSLSRANDGAPPRLKTRFAVMMFLQYFVQGAYLPVVTVYVQDALGFSPAQIGIFSAALAVGPLIAPFIIGQLVDRHVAHEYVLAVCHVIGGVLMLALYNSRDYWPVVILGALYSTLYVPTMMLTNSLAFHHLDDRERDFPLIRLWGTIGFIVPAWLVELYFLKGLDGEELNQARGVILLVSGVAGLVMGAYCLTLPHTPPAGSDRKDVAPNKVLKLLNSRNFLVLVLVSFVVALAHKYFFVWNSPYLKAMLAEGGVTGAWEQRISSIGQIFEILVMAVLGFSIKRFGFKLTMLAGIAAYILRCLILAWAIATDAPFSVAMTAVCFGQALHGFCFGCFLAAAFIYVDRVSPKDARGSMQNFYGTFVVGVGIFAGGFFGGAMGETFTTEPDAPLFRARMGIESRAGVVTFIQKKPITDKNQHEEEKYREVERIRDWPGVWLAGAAVSTVAFIGLAAFFPAGVPNEYDEREGI